MPVYVLRCRGKVIAPSSEVEMGLKGRVGAALRKTERAGGGTASGQERSKYTK